MSEFAPLGQTREIKTYNHGKMRNAPQSQPSGRLLKKPPVIVPEELPEMTMRRIFQESHLTDSADYQSIIGYLTTYQRQGDNRRWDEFRNKIPSPILKLWGDLLIECRRNGFVGPRVEDDKLVWRQVIGTDDSRNGDLCTMCDRECRRREMIDSGDLKHQKIINPGYQERKPCWTREA